MLFCLLEEDVAQLYTAVRSGDLSNVQLLIDSGINVNIADKVSKL